MIDGVNSNSKTQYTIQSLGIKEGSQEASIFKKIDLSDGKDDGYLTEQQYEQYNADIQSKINNAKQQAQSIGDKKPIELGDEEKEGLSIEDNTMLPEHQKEANDIYTKIISKFHERGINLKSNPKMEDHIKNIAVSYVKNHHNPNTYNSKDKIDINGIYLIELKSGYDIVYPNPSDDRYPCTIARLRYDENMNPLDEWGDPIE